jgi:phage-related protein
MPTIKQSLYFTYDGISCKNFGLMHINTSNGMFEEKFVATREINETKVRGNDTPMFHSIEESPLEFEMAIAFEGVYSDADIDNIVIWLFKDQYKPLTFEDYPERVYHCMPVGDSSFVHNGLKQGYAVINMRCKSSKVTSPLKTTPTYDLSNNTGTSNITINNTGHVRIFPEVSIEKVGAGHITINKGGKTFEIRDLANGEKIYLNSEKEIIETDIVGVYRYDKVVGDFCNLGLELGSNTYAVQGKCKITFRYILKYRF